MLLFLYKSLIGNLLYLTDNIIFVANMISRFINSPSYFGAEKDFHIFVRY